MKIINLGEKKILVGLIVLIVALAGFAVYYSAATQNLQKNPKWIKDLIVKNENTDTGQANGSINECLYQNKIVYYITSPCCDEYNYLYDQKKNIICAPDGGITGKGDGKCPDFSSDKNECELIWQKSDASETR